VEETNAKRLKSIFVLSLLIIAVMAGVGVMIDMVDESQANQAVPTTEEVTPSPPNDSSIGQEAGPYR